MHCRSQERIYVFASLPGSGSFLREDQAELVPVVREIGE